jgi:hypothetical protein
MDDKSIRRGGCAGALIASSVTLIVLLAAHFSAGGSPGGGFDVVIGAICLLFFPATLGYCAGLEGAGSKSVAAAFIKGAVFFGCALIVWAVVFLLFSSEWMLGPHAYLVALSFAALLISTGSLISGMAAIVVRDYREYRRWRLFPQFTLQELMIVITLAAIILSAISSWAALRSPLVLD